uniref:Uncharacterized protein n=1 Tax=Oncorhynchus tshawytscha TaxID=74940 RepID=A0AAZ3PNZ2_ONCTS
MTVPVVNLSFAACGFLDKLLGSLRACAGALVAAVMITAPDKLEVRYEFTFRFAKDARGLDICPFVLPREDIEEFLPGDAHSKAGNRLHISITHSKSGKKTILSSLASREDLIKLACHKPDPYNQQ